MSEADTAIQDTVAAYYQAIQGSDPSALISTVRLPFTYCSVDDLQVLDSEAAFVAWWKELMHRVRVQSGFARGKVLRMYVERFGQHAAVLRMLSTRLDADDRPISQQKTGFILYKTSAGWRIASVMTEIEFSETDRTDEV